MFPSTSFGPSAPREAYLGLHRVLKTSDQEELRSRTDALAGNYLSRGVTFDFAGEEAPFPLDPLPRTIEAREWEHIEAGVSQRVLALEAFLADVYGAAAVVRDGIVPAAVIASSSQYYRSARGVEPPNGVRIHVAGADLIRDETGTLRVLEDNVRIPSGVSCVISNRDAISQTLPELIRTMRVRPVDGYPAMLLKALRASAPIGVDDPTVVVLTPGVSNSAYFEHTLLARLMGVELVEGRDLYCQGGRVFKRTTEGARPVGIPARYVSGYLHPSREPERGKAVAGESHAWVEYFAGRWGLRPHEPHPHRRAARGGGARPRLPRRPAPARRLRRRALLADGGSSRGDAARLRRVLDVGRSPSKL